MNFAITIGKFEVLKKARGLFTLHIPFLENTRDFPIRQFPLLLIFKNNPYSGLKKLNFIKKALVELQGRLCFFFAERKGGVINDLITKSMSGHPAFGVPAIRLA